MRSAKTHALATVQVRNVPEGVHRVYRARAAAAGMSLQEHLLAEMIRNAALRAPSDLVRQSEEWIRTDGGEGFALISAAEILADKRASH